VYIVNSEYIRYLRSFEIRFEFESDGRFDSKVIGRFENIRIESAVPASFARRKHSQTTQTINST